MGILLFKTNTVLLKRGKIYHFYPHKLSKLMNESRQKRWHGRGGGTGGAGGRLPPPHFAGFTKLPHSRPSIIFPPKCYCPSKDFDSARPLISHYVIGDFLLFFCINSKLNLGVKVNQWRRQKLSCTPSSWYLTTLPGPCLLCLPPKI